jgi:hypothetical protein
MENYGQEVTIKQEVLNEFHKTMAAIAKDCQHLFVHVPQRMHIKNPIDISTVTDVSARIDAITPNLYLIPSNLLASPHVKN